MKTPQSSRLLVPYLLFAAIGCSAYDEGLLTERRIPDMDPLGGSAGTAVAGMSVATAGTGTGTNTAGTPSLPYGGSGAAGAASAPAAGGGGASGGTGGGTPVAGAPGSGPRCGDGRVDAGETCDTGILPGNFGACPTVCEAPDSCERWSLSGSGCSLTCVPTAISCIHDDGCCPADCTNATDSDCSPACGDGIVQSARGETCEPSPAAGNLRCPAPADCDDGDACTVDAVSGNADNCTAACTHERVTTPRAGDGCCPNGADAGTDTDCAPVCGNGVREGSEQCDGGTGCDGACRLTLTAEQIQCLERFDSNECDSCQCENCAAEVLACRASGNASRDRHCAAVEQCSTEARCAGDACYCGGSGWSGCGLHPSGPCVDVIEAAAGTSLSLSIQNQYGDPDTALGRARALGECRRRNCPTACN